MSVTETRRNDRLPQRVRDLALLLRQMNTLYEELFATIDRRLAAMKRAEWSIELEDSEQAIVSTIADREGLRRHLMDAIGAELGLPPGAGRRLSVSQLAAQLAPEDAGSVQVAADALRPVVAKAAQASRVAGYIARGMIEHLRLVFDAVAPLSDLQGYRGDGAIACRSQSLLFETTG